LQWGRNERAGRGEAEGGAARASARDWRRPTRRGQPDHDHCNEAGM